MLKENRGLIKAGGAIVVLRPNDKKPADSNWTEAARWTWDEAEKKFPEGANIGIRLGKPSRIDGLYCVSFDLDVRSDDPRHIREAWAALARHVPEYERLAEVISGSGGESRHFHGLSVDEPRTKTIEASPEKVKQRDGSMKAAWSLDIGGTGRQFVLPPSIHPKTRQPYRWAAGKPPNWHDLTVISSETMQSWMKREKGSTDFRGLSDLAQLYYETKSRGFTNQEIDGFLDTLADHRSSREIYIENREGWLEVGMCLHHHFAGSEEGFEKWCSFSAVSSKFDAEDSWRVWKSFAKTNKGDPKTAASLARWAENTLIAESTGSTIPAVVEVLASDFVIETQLTTINDSDDDNPEPFKTNWQQRLRVAAYEIEVEHHKVWTAEFDRTQGTNAVKTNVHNTSLIVANDWRLQGWLGYNEFTKEQVQRLPLKRQVLTMMNLPQVDWVGGDNLSKEHEHNLRLFLAKPPVGHEPGYGMNPTDRDLKTAVVAACYNNPFHPIRNYLNAVRWDGVPRIETMFSRFLGTPNDQYHRDVALMVMVAAVARIYEPGCKFDYAVILEGKEGLRKSSFIRELAARPQWFGELHGDFSDRKGLVEQMQGNWQLEMPELSGFGKGAVLKVKAFMSAQFDDVRLAYEARSVKFLRQCILWGTTNDRTYLMSETGERRFWPVEVRKHIDTMALRAEIDQLWAEAVHIYRTMRAGLGMVIGPGKDLPLFLQHPESQAQALEYQGSRKVETMSDIVSGQIEEMLNTPMTLAEIHNDPAGKFDEGKYLISKVCSLWLHDRFGEGRPMMDSKVYTTAMRKLKGWNESASSLGFGKHGKQRGFTREGATMAELRHGYMRKDD